MKKTAVFLLALIILVGCVGVYAAGGTASDPLISLSYLTQTYLPDTVAQAGQRVDEKTRTTYQSVVQGLEAQHSAYLLLAVSGEEDTASSALTDARYKKGDVISLPAGSGVLLLAGSAVMSYTADGAVVDTTAGTLMEQGSTLIARHRYLVGERTTAAVTVTSDTAVLSTEGASALAASTETDYNALAAALKELGLFRGTGTGYGSGFDLEVIPTRVEGLVMFLRLIGEESAALSYTGENPFVDTPAWCERYTAYAYARGYTKGVGANKAGELYFGTSNVMSAGEYVTFLLRAMGYSDSGANPDFSWSNAVSRAVAFGVLTAGEERQLSGQTFLRTQVAYVSYFCLNAPKKGGGTLLSSLTASGVLNSSQTTSIMNNVTVSRIS